MVLMWCHATLIFSALATISWLAQTVASDERTFAVVSNAIFVADVALIPVVSRAYLIETHPMVYASTLASALLGGASFAHHFNRSYSPAHTLDIAMAWILYLHIALLATYALVHRVVAWPYLLLATSLAEGLGIVALFTAFPVVYAYQVAILTAFGATAFACTFAHRWMLRAARRKAVLDFAALVALQVVATMLQGEMWYKSVSPARYNVEHGYWHLLNGTIVGIVVVQTAELLRTDYVAPAATDGSDGICRAALVCFALFLVTATVLNGDDGATTSAILPVQVLLLSLSGTLCYRANTGR